MDGHDYNCNSFVGEIARFIGLQTPSDLDILRITLTGSVGERRMIAAPAFQPLRLSALHHDHSTDLHTRIEIKDILVIHANATVRDESADQLRSVCAVNGVFAALDQQRRIPHRI